MATEEFKSIAKNKKARFAYDILETYEAGVALVGTEVKSIREGSCKLDESYVKLDNGEAYMIGCNIAPYSSGSYANHLATRRRKLLLHRRELHKIEIKAVQKGITVVPLRLYFKRGMVKAEIALVRGKREFDKRETMKRRDAERDIRRAMDQKRKR